MKIKINRKLESQKQTPFRGEWVDRITCKEFVEWVTDYLEDKLPDGQRIRVEAHLAECPACPIYLEQMRLTIRTCGKLSASLTEVTPTARRELLDVFTRWKAGED